jgi:hypothetical protein
MAQLPEPLSDGISHIRLGNLQSVRDELERMSVPVRIHPSLTFDSQSCLEAGPGVHLLHRQPEDVIDTIQLARFG